MLANLAVVLMGLAAIVAVLTFVGAHSSPVNVPNISKGGCLVSVSLVVVGFGAAMYEPVAKFNACSDICVEALTDVDGDHGDADVYVSPGRVQYKACHKGAVEAEAKARKEAEKNNTTMTYEVEDPDRLEARCRAEGAERCTTACFEGVAPDPEDQDGQAGAEG